MVCTFDNPSSAVNCEMCTIPLGTVLEGGVPLQHEFDRVFRQEGACREMIKPLTRGITCNICTFLNEGAQTDTCTMCGEHLPKQKVTLREIKILDQFGPAFKVTAASQNGAYTNVGC